MNKEKICPLLSIKNEGISLLPCGGQACAWWDGGQCVLCSIADNLGDIAVSTMEVGNDNR